MVKIIYQKETGSSATKIQVDETHLNILQEYRDSFQMASLYLDEELIDSLIEFLLKKKIEIKESKNIDIRESYTNA